MNNVQMFNSATIDESRTSALHFANEMLQAGGEMLKFGYF